MTIPGTDFLPSLPATARRISADVHRNETVVRLEGEIDLSASEQLEELRRTLPPATRRVVLDVTGVTFCDGTLAGFVADLARVMPVSVRPPHRLVVELLRIAGLAGEVAV
jgi:anti-anti-sigma factor